MSSKDFCSLTNLKYQLAEYNEGSLKQCLIKFYLLQTNSPTFQWSLLLKQNKQHHHQQQQKNQQKPTTFVLLGIKPRANILPMSHIPKPLSYYLTVFGKVVHSPEMERNDSIQEDSKLSMVFYTWILVSTQEAEAGGSLQGPY